jgi:hypothetical protein
MQVPSKPDVAGLLDRSMAGVVPGGRGCGAVRAGRGVSEQKVGFRPTVALQAFAPGRHMPHSCVPEKPKTAICSPQLAALGI